MRASAIIHIIVSSCSGFATCKSLYMRFIVRGFISHGFSTTAPRLIALVKVGNSNFCTCILLFRLLQCNSLVLLLKSITHFAINLLIFLQLYKNKRFSYLRVQYRGRYSKLRFIWYVELRYYYYSFIFYR